MKNAHRVVLGTRVLRVTRVRFLGRVSAVFGLMVFTSLCLGPLYGCGSIREVCVENVSTFDYQDVTVGGQLYGDIAAGGTSEYKSVKMKFRYAIVKLTVDGQYINGQTLNFRSQRFTYRIDVKDRDAGQLGIEVVRD